jgi:hypothetical protein
MSCDRVRSSRRLAAALAVGLSISACAAKPTAEDERRAAALRADPVFAHDIAGVVEQRVSVDVGHGTGAETVTTDVIREGTVAGDPAVAVRDAVNNAAAAGWFVQTIHCSAPDSHNPSESYLVYGVKQLDGFVGYLTISSYFSGGQRFRLDASAESARRPGSASLTPNQTSTTAASPTSGCLSS